MTIVGVLGTATMVLVMWEKFSQPEYRTLRAIVFVSLGLLSALPTIHFIVQVKTFKWKTEKFIIPLRCLKKTA
jgi:hypothetical protein